MPITYTTSDAPSEQLASAVGTGLDDHNLSVAPSLNDVKPLAAAAMDEDGQLIGGAIGRTWGLCCELLELWVAPEARKTGIGSGLLIRFENHARQRGCTSFYLTTLSYQAPDFYKKHGYTAIASISGYPHGIVKHLMLKTDT
jgi:GNAT superfamily N-acetyltransferase